MAMKPYPSNLIIFDIDEREFTQDMKLAIMRSWTHIGQVLVRTHQALEVRAEASGVTSAGEGAAIEGASAEGTPAEGTPAENLPSDAVNFMHVMVKFGTRHYLYSSDDESDENWNDRMEHHLLSTMRKIGENNIAFNRTQRRQGEPELRVSYIEFELEQGAFTLEFTLDSNSALPDECAKVATSVRALLNAGELGEPVRVRMPSKASLAAQAQLAAQRKAEAEAAEAQRLAEEEAAARAEAEARAAEVDFVEEPELVEVSAAEELAADAQKVSPLEVAPMTEEEWEANYGVPDVDFDIDYSVGEAVYADGTTKEFSLASRD